MKHLYLLCFFMLLHWGNHAQEQTGIDFKQLDALIRINPAMEKVSGSLTYTLDVLEDTDSIFIDAKNMKFKNVRYNGQQTQFYNDGQRIWLIGEFPEGTDNTIKFDYMASPGKAMYFRGWDSFDSEEVSVRQVWTQGQGKETSNWLPSFDDPNEKLVFDLSIEFPEGYRVISGGKRIGKTTLNDSLVRWDYNMIHPMSSYLVAVAAGKYARREKESQSGVPLIYYYYPDEEEKFEPTYRYSKKIFDFLEQEVGVEYPWQNYKQVPVKDFLYSGMENTGATIFSDIFLTDSVGFKDRNYIMVNAHELAHQWFGNLVTAATGEDHWLHEGFATYFALLAEKEIFGENYYYWKLFNSAQQLKERSDAGEGQAILSSSANSLTYYQKGAWALHILREIVGDVAFREGIRNYLMKYRYDNVSTLEFLQVMEEASGKDLSQFREDWLEQSAFQAYAALNSIKESKFIRDYMLIAGLKEVPLEQKREGLNAALDFPVNDYIGQEVIYQLSAYEPLEVLDLYRKAFNTNNIFVRQAIATSLTSIPEILRKEYESLLKDDSYLTKELALYNLWMNFPRHRERYLEELEGVEGFYDKNIRTLWLALHLATPEYHPEDKIDIYTKLKGYTSMDNPFHVRQNAFRYLFQLSAFDQESLKNLLSGTQSPVSRYRTFSREMVEALLQDEVFRLKLMEIITQLPANQQNFLESKLNEITLPKKTESEV